MPMLSIPNDILTKFEAILEKRLVAVERRFEFKKWPRYFLDFCSKYPDPDTRSDRVRLFIEKLRDKGQSSKQQKQAAYAVSLYFETQLITNDSAGFTCNCITGNNSKKSKGVDSFIMTTIFICDISSVR